MQVIMCNVNLFDADQEVFLVKDGEKKLLAKTPMSNLHKVLPELCVDKNVYEIVLCGHDPVIDKLIQDTYAEETKKYSMDKITIYKGERA